MTIPQPEFSSIFVKYYLLMTQYAIQRDHPRENRTLRTAAQTLQRLIPVFRLSGGGFLNAYEDSMKNAHIEESIS